MTALTNTLTPNELHQGPRQYRRQRESCVVGAIFAGAAAAAALSLILLILGTGLGLSSVSPWTQVGVSAATSAHRRFFDRLRNWLRPDGRLSRRRLRTKWLAVHTDEVYFRDTATAF
jgi:hypothetical protein